MAIIDPQELSISNDPFIGDRVLTSKYEPIFGKMQVGQRVVCPPGTASRVAVQMRSWLKRRGYVNLEIRSRENYPDGQGGVWWLAGEKKAQTRWNTPGNRAPGSKK